jgi:hypothetical protein
VLERDQSGTLDPRKVPASVIKAVNLTEAQGGSPLTIFLRGVEALLDDEKAMNRGRWYSYRQHPDDLRRSILRALASGAFDEKERSTDG